MNSHLKNTLYNIKNVIEIKFFEKKEIETGDEKLYSKESIYNDDGINYTKPYLSFHFPDKVFIHKTFENEDNAKLYMEMIESRYSILDLRKERELISLFFISFLYCFQYFFIKFISIYFW